LRSLIKYLILILIIIALMATAAVVTYILFGIDHDDGKIGINIVTGKCEIDIVDSSENTLVGEVLDFVSESGDNTVYFAPGKTYYTEGFRLKNTGTVPVNFRVYISEDESLDKETFEEAFEVWMTNNKEETDIENKLTAFKDELGVGEISETYYLVIKMKEEAGNEFQNQTFAGIGITVYAMQNDTEIKE